MTADWQRIQAPLTSLSMRFRGGYSKNLPTYEREKYLYNYLYKIDNRLYDLIRELKTDMARTKEASHVN